MTMNLEKAQQIYRVLINNPFWKDYDMTYFMEVKELFYRLQLEISRCYPWNSDVRKKNRAAVLFGAMCHDFNLMMNNLYYSKIEDVSDCHKMSENKKIVMQSWLHDILRRLAFEEEIKSTEDHVAYLIDYMRYCPEDYDNKHDRLKKFTTVMNDDGTYRAVTIVNENMREKLIAYFDKWIGHYSMNDCMKNTRQAFIEEVERLKTGMKVTEYFAFES